MKVEERLLNYASVWTTSDPENGAVMPSSERQFDLARIICQELTDLGLSEVLLDEHCYVYGLLPATPGMENAASIGFIAHMDTAPDFRGKGVKPQIIPNYDGQDVLLTGSGDYLKVKDFPDLAGMKGQTLITTDGTTLLGADDKAGCAEIITAIERIIQENIPHGDIWLGFTPDEEIGNGAEMFNLDYFKAEYAYTVDGSQPEDVACETFNAASAVFQIKGVSVHPGEAKNIMVNAGLIATEIAQKFPADETPATTDGRQGFYHLISLSGDVTQASLSYIVRDHDREKFAARKAYMLQIEKEMQAKYGKDTISLTLRDSYLNMYEIIEQHPHVVDRAKAAIRAIGLEPVSLPVRGGTDGARLSFMGLPCPNLGTAGMGFHGPFEHITVEGMEAVVDIIMHIADGRQ